MKAISVTLLTAFLLGMLTAIPAVGQVLYGSAVGTVVDQSGSSVPSATVSLTNKLNGQVREIQTGQDGRYTAPNLLPGEYDLNVTAAGFRAYTQTGLQITINTVTRADVRLELGQLTEQVTVSSAAVALQTDKSDVHAELGSQAVANLPLAATGTSRTSSTSCPARLRRLPEQRGLHTGARHHKCEWHGPQQQQRPRGWRHQRLHLAAASHGLRAAGRIHRDRERHHGFL